MIRLDVIGHIGQDATISEVGGKQVVNFSVAHTYKSQSGNESTTWVKCSLWERANMAQHLKKGTQVYVSGTPSIEVWQNKNDEAQGTIKLNVYDIQLLSSKKEA